MTPRRISRGITWAAWTISCGFGLYLYVLILQYESQRSEGSSWLAVAGWAVAFAVMSAMIATFLWAAMHLVVQPFVQGWRFDRRRRLIAGLGTWPDDAPKPTAALVAYGAQWARNIQRARLARGLIAGGLLVVLVAAIVGLAVTGRPVDHIAWVAPLAIVVLGAMFNGRLSWLDDPHRFVARDLMDHLEASGIDGDALRWIAFERVTPTLRVRLPVPSRLDVRPVTMATLEDARDDERTGDGAFDDATRVELPTRAEGPVQSWLTDEVRRALMPVLAHGGRVADAHVEATFDVSDPRAVYDLVPAVDAMTRVVRALDDRAQLGLRARMVDALDRARTEAERDALIEAIQRTVLRADADAVAETGATTLRGAARVRALELAGDRARRIALALGIDDDSAEDAAVRGAAIGVAIHEGSTRALQRLRDAIDAADARRVVEAAVACGRALSGDEAAGLGPAAETSALPASVLAAVLVRLVPDTARLASERLAEAIASEAAVPGSPAARAADVVAACDIPTLADAGADLAARIATSRQGGLAITADADARGGLAVSAPGSADPPATRRLR